MKKNILFLIAVFMLSIVATPVVAQSRKDKKAAQKAEWEMEQQRKKEEAELMHQMRMDSIRAIQEARDAARREAEEAKNKQKELDGDDLEMKKLTLENAKKSLAKRVGQKLFTPCVDESYDMPGEYMAGLGIAENEVERGAARINANRYALADISSRYLGVIKNGVSQYAKNNNTASGQKIKQNELEGEAMAIGEKAINKYAEAVCTEFEQADDGTYTCYVAVHVPLEKVLNETIDELGVLKTDYDRKQFREWMESELNKQAEEKDLEKQVLMEMRGEISK